MQQNHVGTEDAPPAIKSPKRSPASGGYPRGVEQRARIIQAALKLFGDEGYERASTRMIAREAGIEPPALQYYFDGKEGLHRACAEFIVAEAMARLRGPLDAAAALPDTAPREAVLAALCELFDWLIDASLFKREVAQWSRFSARVQSENSPAASVLREKMSLPIADTVGRLIALASGAPVDEIVRLRTQLLLGQIFGLSMHYDVTLARLGWPDFDGPRRALLKTVLHAHLQGALAEQITLPFLE